ncbi:hypothetical protein DPEC_G00362480 [Dallia pectoralis]|nr:hypothetical protein DPEC_G00362480 [Dallia pectoralis]
MSPVNQRHPVVQKHGQFQMRVADNCCFPTAQRCIGLKLPESSVSLKPHPLNAISVSQKPPKGTLKDSSSS